MLTAEKTPFFTSLQQLFLLQDPSHLKEKAWNQFVELGLPDPSSEAFKYLPLRKLYDLRLLVSNTPLPSKEIIHSFVLPEAEGSYLFFGNGHFSKELSCPPPQLEILQLQEALKIYSPFLQSRLNKNLKEETDPFAILNLALEQGGVFCYLPPHLKLEKPLQIIFYGEGHASYHPCRIHFFCSLESEIQIISTVAGSGVHHTAIDVALEEKARFSQVALSTQTSGFHLNDFKATLKSSSSLKHLCANTTQCLTRNRLRVLLLEENCEALLQGVWNLHGNHQCHTHAHVEHAAPCTRSLQKFKGVLRDQSQSSFEGRIYVHPQAQKTEAYQLNHHLLLGERAIAHAKPNLEIFADDVKASHGATMSQVDEEHLFYLQSRGMSQEVAKNLLVEGFVREIFDQIPYKSLCSFEKFLN